MLLLFNDGHVHVRSETVAVHRRMNMLWIVYDGHMITGDEYALNFVTYYSWEILRKLQPENLTELGIEPEPAAREKQGR